MLGRSYTLKEIAPQGKICSEVIFGQNHLKGCVARWIRIMALAGVLFVSGLFALSYIVVSFSETHNNHTHHPFINNFITITDSIIILSYNRTYSILVIIVSLIDHNRSHTSRSDLSNAFRVCLSEMRSKGEAGSCLRGRYRR